MASGSRRGVRAARTAWLGVGIVWIVGLAPAWAERSVGVVAFERVAARGQVVPDVASRLAQRLGTRGLDKVVGPVEFGIPPTANPAPGDISDWAQEAGVGVVVVGRTTRLGRSLSVDARLYDANGGMVGAPLIEEVTRVEDLGRAIEALADQVVERVGQGGAIASVGSAPPGTAAGTPGAPAKSGRYSENSPISIRADELESRNDGDSRKFLFRGHVRAVQDDLIVNSDRMVAFYPPGRSSPDRMVATGHVKLEQTGRVAFCSKAIFYRHEQRIVCTGNLAELEQNCDRVRGEQITFHLDTEVMHVVGSADVRLRPDDPACSGGVAGAEAGR